VSEKKLYYKLSPELVDGDHWTPVGSIDQVLASVKLWCEEFGREEGESFTVEIISMTDEEFDALPEI